jgi:hypothetical protein
VSIGKIGGRLAALALLIVSSACAASQTSALLDDAGGLPPHAEVSGVPFVPQEDLYCGPAVVATMRTWAGSPTTQAEAADMVWTPGKEGTLRDDVAGAVRRGGLLGVRVRDMRALLAELAAGHPVVVFQNLGLDSVPVWHYAVAVGYDLPARRIILRSGRIERRATELSTFERTWKRGDQWAMTVTTPDKIPPTAREADVVDAILGLERTGANDAALTAYEAAAVRWPRSFELLVGLGTARYLADDPKGAEAALRRAVTTSPNAPGAWNNLAYALHAQDRTDEAIAAASRAVDLAPSDGREPFLDTLVEVGGHAPVAGL